METEINRKGGKSKATVTKTIAVIAIVGLTAIGAWSAARIGAYIPDAVERFTLALVSLRQTFIPAEKITFETDSAVVRSGSEIKIEWSHNAKKEKGLYSLTYPCIDIIEIISKDSEFGRPVECDKPFDIDDETTSVLFQINSMASNPVIFPINIYYTKLDDASPSLSATTNISVLPSLYVEESNLSDESTEKETPIEDVQTSDTTDTSNTSNTETVQKELTAGEKTENTYLLGTTTNNTEPKAYGKTDLKPRIIEVGIIDRITNEFTATSTLKSSERIAIKFEVENIGTANSGMWQFNAALPTFPSHIFQSDTLQALDPGDKIEFVLGFDNVLADQDSDIVINVDPTGSISEASEDNNIARTTIHAKSN